MRAGMRSRVAGTLAAVLVAAGCGDGTAGVNGEPPPPPPGGTAFEVVFSTYVGGSADEEIREPLLLPDGRLLFGSRTFSADQPTTAGAVQPAYGGGTGDAWLGILSADGSRLEAGTFLGGSGMERTPYGIEVMPDGDIVVTTGTTSPNIPTSAGAYRRALHSPVPSPGDGFVCRLSGDLRARRWCTYTGGGWSRGGLVVARDGSIVVAGRTTGVNFTTTTGAFQRLAKGTDDGFLLKLSADGGSAVFSTRLGGTGSRVGEVIVSVREGANGDYAINGISTSMDFPTTPGAPQAASPGPKDAFFAQFSADGSTLVRSSLLGGSAEDLGEHRMALLDSGVSVAVGFTESADLPGAIGSYRGNGDGWVAKLDPSGSSFEFVRYLGGSGQDALVGPVVDAAGRIYVVGRTTSTDIPVTADAFQSTFQGGAADGVVFILSPSGSIEYASYIGGDGDEMVRAVVVGPAGEVFLAGRTASDNFPVTAGAFQTSRRGGDDGFILKLRPAG